MRQPGKDLEGGGGWEVRANFETVAVIPVELGAGSLFSPSLKVVWLFFITLVITSDSEP